MTRPAAPARIQSGAAIELMQSNDVAPEEGGVPPLDDHRLR